MGIYHPIRGEAILLIRSTDHGTARATSIAQLASRHVENRFVTSESNFVPIEWWNACVDLELRPEPTDPRLAVWVGVDASVKRDSTAIVCCTFDQVAKKVRLVWHRIFQPSPDDPLLFEDTIERTLLDLRRRFWVREVRFDPYQMQATAQRLTAQGVPMLEFPQSVPNLTEASERQFREHGAGCISRVSFSSPL